MVSLHIHSSFAYYCLQLIIAFSKWFTTAKSAHKQFLLEKRNNNFENAFFFEDAKVHYLRLAREISNQLSDSLVQFDYGLITLGLALSTIVRTELMTRKSDFLILNIFSGSAQCAIGFLDDN